MSHPYWANFSTSYIWLEPIFLSPDWNPTTHMTWQTSTASNNSPKMKDRTFLKRFAKKFKKKVQNPYSGTWTRTREPGPVLVYALIWFFLYSFMYSNWEVGPISMGHTVSVCFHTGRDETPCRRGPKMYNDSHCFKFILSTWRKICS